MKDPAVFIPDRDPPKGDAKWYMDQVKGAKCFFVTVTIPPEKELDFKEAIQADVRGSRLEEGCLLFDVAESGRPGRAELLAKKGCIIGGVGCPPNCRTSGKLRGSSDPFELFRKMLHFGKTP